jgi:hypothetical protein
MLPWLTGFLQQNFCTLQLIFVPFPVLTINLRPYLKYGFFREGWLRVEFEDLAPQLSPTFRPQIYQYGKLCRTCVGVHFGLLLMSTFTSSGTSIGTYGM